MQRDAACVHPVLPKRPRGAWLALSVRQGRPELATLQCVWATDDDRRTVRGRERELYEEIAQLRAQNASLIALVGVLCAGTPVASTSGEVRRAVL